jgi:hypothetical protein
MLTKLFGLSARRGMAEETKAALNEALIAAARAGDVLDLRLLLDQGAEPDAHGATGETPLLAATRDGQLESVCVLLAAGADPDVCGGDILRGVQVSPLQEAAARGFNAVVQLLLESGADPEARNILGYGEPVFQAASRGHEEIARVIRDHITQSRRRKQREYFDSHGYTAMPDRIEGFQIFLSGTQNLPHPDTIMPLVVRPRLGVAPDIPFTVFDGWLKQIDSDRMTVEQLEALDETFPAFSTFDRPTFEQLPNLPPPSQKAEPSPIRLFRERRFAGDHLLPRLRYHAVCDESGNDNKTLCKELFAYRDVRLSGGIRMFDPTDAVDKRALQPPWNAPSPPMVYVRVDPGGFNRYLRRAGLEQKPLVFLFPVRVARERIKNVVNLRQPATQLWFVRFFSDFVDDISAWSRGVQQSLRWWPRRPRLESFEQILPSLITQELGGNTFTRGVGSWLRRANVNGLIYPSARCDASLILTNGTVTGFCGWNFVDYRGAEPPQPQAILDVDDYWPDRVRVGPGMGIRSDLPTELFEDVTIDFIRRGPHNGSFQVKNLESSAQQLYELEISALRERRPFKPWWQL